MARKKHSAEQIIHKLREAEVALAQGKDVKAVCKQLEVTEQTYYRWRKEYGGLKAGPGQAPEGARARERPTQEAARGPGARQRDPERGRRGKLLSPQRRREAVTHVREKLWRVRNAVPAECSARRAALNAASRG